MIQHINKMENNNVEYILEKLSKIEDDKDSCITWNDEERKQLLQIYLLISKKETYIFDLIYHCHRCDSWEDIFRDYDPVYLIDKANGVKVAIDELTEPEDMDATKT